MKTRRVLHALLLTALDLPTFDSEVDDWLIAHNLIEVAPVGGSVSLTVVGANLLNNTIQLFDAALNSFHAAGQLRRPEDHDQKEDHNDNTDNRTPQQARRKAAKGRKGD